VRPEFVGSRIARTSGVHSDGSSGRILGRARTTSEFFSTGTDSPESVRDGSDTTGRSGGVPNEFIAVDHNIDVPTAKTTSISWGRLYSAARRSQMGVVTNELTNSSSAAVSRAASNGLQPGPFGPAAIR
jgi:hypothetical protein